MASFLECAKHEIDEYETLPKVFISHQRLLSIHLYFIACMSCVNLSVLSFRYIVSRTIFVLRIFVWFLNTRVVRFRSNGNSAFRHERQKKKTINIRLCEIIKISYYLPRAKVFFIVLINHYRDRRAFVNDKKTIIPKPVLALISKTVPMNFNRVYVSLLKRFYCLSFTYDSRLRCSSKTPITPQWLSSYVFIYLNSKLARTIMHYINKY